MSVDRYEAVIGLEVHAQLQTRSKAFSPDSASFGGEPNTHIDPISLGHPGTLPVLNARVAEFAVRLGLAVGCRIAPRSILARKHYFYPDLPKGYQISQYETPICEGGHIDLPDEAGGTRRIRLRRIHVEEDAGKSVHDQDPYATLLDYNRCGVPLVELVTEPDLRSPHDAYVFMQKMRQIVRYLEICDGNMEEGSLRCDANVSIREPGSEGYGIKTELKNMNSFRHVERALEYEIARQIRIVEAGGTVEQATLLWDPNRQETRPMRTKEEAHDYRYMPDPDLVPIVVTDAMIAGIAASLPEMPEQRIARLTGALGLPAYDAGVITEDRPLADYFDAALAALDRALPDTPAQQRAKAVSNAVMTDVLRELNERGLTPQGFPVQPERLAGLLAMRLQNKVSSTGGAEIFAAMLETDDPPERIATERNLLQVSDEGALRPAVETVVEQCSSQVQQYLSGKQGVLGFLVGQVMRSFPGSPDPKLVREILLDTIEKKRT